MIANTVAAKPPDMSVLNDSRTRWICSKLNSGLLLDFHGLKPVLTTSSEPLPPSVVFAASHDLFLECMETNDNVAILKSFLDDFNLDSALLFWLETKTIKHVIPLLKIKEVDVELVEVIGEIIEEGTLTAPLQETLITESVDPTLSQTIDNNTQEIGNITEPIEEQENFVFYEVTELHMAYQIFPENLSELNAMYFLKNNPGPVPRPSGTLLFYKRRRRYSRDRIFS
jgi:hypothetical protein